MKLSLLPVLLFVLLPLLWSCAAPKDTLPRAAEFQNQARIHTLLQAGHPVDERDARTGETALITAARRGNLGIVKTLLDAGADLHAQTPNGTALTAASVFCQTGIAKLLIERGSKVDNKNAFGATPLIFAAKCNDPQLIEILLDRGVDINAINLKGTTPLYQAASHGNVTNVNLLISRGATVDMTSNDINWSPLMIAAAEGHENVVERLLDAGAQVNFQNRMGRTAVMFAAWYGNSDIVAMLLAKGADPNLVPQDKGRMPALTAATIRGYKEVVKLLLDAGADPHIIDEKGKTALQCADDEIAEMLRAAGARY